MRMIYVNNHLGTGRHAIYYEDNRGNILGCAFEDDKDLTFEEKEFFKEGKEHYNKFSDIVWLEKK